MLAVSRPRVYPPCLCASKTALGLRPTFMMFLVTLMFANVSFAGARGHEERSPSGLMRRTQSQSHSTSTGLFYWEPAAPATVCNVREGPAAVAPIVPLKLREHLGNLLAVEGLKHGVEVGVKDGLFASSLLQRWGSQCKSYLLVDLWRSQANYVDSATTLTCRTTPVLRSPSALLPLLRSPPTSPCGQSPSLDPLWQANNQDQEQAMANALRLRRKYPISTCRDYSVACASRLTNESMDFVYLDARHDCTLHAASVLSASHFCVGPIRHTIAFPGSQH